MTQTPHLDPLPSVKGRRGLLSAYGVTKAAIVLWLLAVGVRLVLIDQPYVDYWSWRQSDVAAIARNFFEYGFRFGYPQIDWAGGSGGTWEQSFPFYLFSRQSITNLPV